MSATRLGELQDAFCDFVVHGRSAPALETQLRSRGAGDSELQLDVYRNAYFIRLEKALAHDFPLSAKLLGPQSFARLAAEYVLAYPSRHPSLRYLGHALPGWLGEHTGVATGDLAAIEWAAMQVLDGCDREPVDAGRLEGIAPADWPRLALALMPTLSLLEISSNADRVWLSGAEGHELVETKRRRIAVSRGAECRPCLTELSSETFLVLEAVSRTNCLADASDEVAKTAVSASLPEQIATAIHVAFAHGWVTGVGPRQVAE